MTRRAKGFTLLELILAIVIGFSLCSLLIQMGTMSRHHTDALFTAETQTDLLRESELLVSEYRDRLGNASPNVEAMLTDWAPGNGVVKSLDRIVVQDTGGSFQFTVRIYKVGLTRDGQTYYTYFTE